MTVLIFKGKASMVFNKIQMFTRLHGNKTLGELTETQHTFPMGKEAK